MPVTIEVEIPVLTQAARGTVYALRPDGSTIHSAAGDWLRAGTRNRFSRDVARLCFPDLARTAGEGDAAYADRTSAQDAMRRAAEMEVCGLLLIEIDRLRQERVARLEAEAKQAFKGEIEGTPEQPKILISTEEHRVTAEAIAALAADPDLYHRGGRLVRVCRDRSPKDGISRMGGSPTIQPMPPPSLREKLTQYSTLVKVKQRDGENVESLAHPPPWLVDQVCTRGDWPAIRPLTSVSDSPILRPDGTLCQTAGYDSRTGVLYEPRGQFPPVHPEVGKDEAVDAVDTLREVIQDFRFEAPEHESAWFAALLTPLARFAFDGPAPGFVIDANVRGAGKGLAAQCIGRLALGRDIPISSYSQDVEEMRKKITSICLAGDRMVLFDNIAGNFGDPVLDAALTSTTWKDRLLGKNDQPELPLWTIFYFTGNNVAVAADTARRLIHIRLDVLEEKPEERKDFTHPNLLAWVSTERPRMLAAALTILVAYCNAGRPDMGLSPYGSFEGWSALVRQAVAWTGLPDPCLTRQKLAENSDTTADVLAQLLDAWRSYDALGRGVFVGEMLATLYPQDRLYAPKDEISVSMRSALETIVNCPPGKIPTVRQVGNRLRAYRRRVIRGCYIDVDPTRSLQGMRWRILSSNGTEVTEGSHVSDASDVSVSAPGHENALFTSVF